MTISECPAFATVDDAVRAFANATEARRIHAAGWFEVGGARYRVAYGAGGPEVVRHGGPSTIGALLRHVPGGPLASREVRLSRRLAQTREADRQCLIGALEAWRDERPGEGRHEAIQRLLQCRDEAARELDLRGLRLSGLPPAIGSLRHLAVLRLGNNDLSAVPAPLRSLRGIRVLELDGNRIEAVPAWLSRLSDLQVLSLNANRIGHWPKPVASLRKLAYLWLQDNAMTRIPLDIATAPQSCETFLAGNPLDEFSRDLLHAADGWRPDAPIHYDTASHPSYPLLRDPPAGVGAVQRGRLPSFVHLAADSDEVPRVHPASCLTAQQAEQCARLFRRVAHALTQASVPARRTAAILDYRLDLIEHWMHGDAELYRQCSAAIEIGLEDCVDRLIATLDEVELALIEAALERRPGSAAELAQLGRGLYRLNLLSALVCRDERRDGTLDRLLAYRTMLADELSLPLEVRRVSLEQWASTGLSAWHLDWMRDTVLRMEARDDHAGLDDFISAWKPWQQYVRRADPDWMERLNLGLQQALEDAAAGVAAGTCSPQAHDRLVRTSPQRFEALFRRHCREMYRAQRAAAPAAESIAP